MYARWIRLSGAKLMRFKHNDPADLQELLNRQVGKTQRKLILVESVYSMDGDLAPLREIAQLAVDHEAMLMVDEAMPWACMDQMERVASASSVLPLR